MLEVLGERLEPGVVIGGAYRLERIVGEGGMGVVWAARETTTGRAVALKFLRSGADGDPKQRERFVREARAAMTVVHPNVAKVDAVLETDVGAPFLVMELLEGESMRTLLTRRGRLPAVEAARLLTTVIDAVSAAHAARIVHRDLKPENIFLVRGTDVRVLDFGIAKRLPASSDATATPAITTTGALLGTPLYMAPEQIFGEEVDPSADVWALGIIVYECIAGRRPTDADGFGPIIKRITVDPIEPLERVEPSCPPLLARLVGRMLTRDRSQRPTLTEVRATLAQIVDGAPISAEAMESAPHTKRIGPPPDAPTAPLRAIPKPKPEGLLKQNVVPLAIGGALAFVILIVAFSVAIATAVANKDKFKDDAPKSPSARSDEAHAALDEARAAANARDGKTCLAKVDHYDQVTIVLKTNVPGSLYSDIRAKCLLLSGRCTEGKSLMRSYLEKNHIATTPLEDRLEVIVGEQCEGDDLSPREALFRARYRLKTQASPTAAQCDAWFATLEGLLKDVPSRGLLDKPYADVVKERPTLLSECRARAR